MEYDTQEHLRLLLPYNNRGDTITLPTFLICGAQKSGTTSLQEKLGCHPDVYIPPTINIGGTNIEREIHYFDYNYDQPLEWYTQKFNGHNQEKAIGEKTPEYLHIPPCPHRIKQTIPNVKLLFILRDPRYRAYSNYWMYRRNSGDTTPFKKIVWTDKNSMLRIGHYHQHLKRYTDIFPRSQIKIWTLRQLKNQPTQVYHEAYKHIDVNPDYQPPDPQKRHYKGGSPRSTTLSRIRQTAANIGLPVLPHAINLLNTKGQALQLLLGSDTRAYPSMSHETLRMLTEHYRPHNRRLEALFPELDVGHWYEVEM